MKGQPLPPDLGALAALGPRTPGLCTAVMGPGLEPPPPAPSLPTTGPGQAQPRSPATRDFSTQHQGVCDTCLSWRSLNVKLCLLYSVEDPWAQGISASFTVCPAPAHGRSPENPILDKENKVKFRSNMGSLYHGISTATGEACGWRDTWATQADGSC